MVSFSRCSGINIYGGNFTNYQTEDAAATQVLGKRKRQDSDSECDSSRRQRSRILDSDELMILKSGDVELRGELIGDGDNSYRIHAASHGGRLVAVKTFEGPRAKQDWKVNVAFSKKCLHPNVLQIVGISDESSTNHFIQFRGITSEQKMQWLIANALGTDLNTSVQLSMKAVKGIAAGLSYIKSQRIPVMYAGTMNNNQKWDNFDILTGYDNEPIIAFHLSSTTEAEDGSVSQNLDIQTDSRGIEVLNGLCDQLFSGAHSILYDDSPKREFDVVYDSEGLPVEHEESTSNLSESEATSNRSNPMENSTKPIRKPRREVWWLPSDLGATNHSLKSIRRCFENRLNRSLLSSSNSLLHRIRSPKDDYLRRNLHQCPQAGYLREEITLTCDLSKSVIVSHAFPGLSERCSICHQLVQYTSESSDHFAPVGGIDPFTPNIGGKSSDDQNGWQDKSLPEFLWMTQFQQNLGSGQMPSFSTSHMDAEESRSEESREQYPLHPPAPKVKMSLRDFALRKKKQREEKMRKNIQDTPSSTGVDLPFGRSEGGGDPNGIQVNPVGQVSRNGKTVELKEDSVNEKDSSYQGASTLSRTYPIATHRSKQELIEQPIHTAVTIQPRTMDSTRYAAMYNHSESILPINPDSQHFQSYSPPGPCQEDGEIGEILDTPLQPPSSSLPSSLPAATPAMNRLASMATTIPGSISPLPRGPTSKRVDFDLTLSASLEDLLRIEIK